MPQPANLEIDIRPEVNILGVLRHLNYKPWYALAEFVDNSIASGLETGLATEASPIRVSITIEQDDGGRIVVTDNAGGIAGQDFPRAFRAAQAPPDRSGLSEFGMGMKTAASWFSREWEVVTTALGEPVKRTIKFNLDDIQDLQTDHLPVFEYPEEPDTHFTRVELTQLHRIPKGRTLGKMKDHLASIYRDFLRKGIVEIVFNGRELSYDEVQPLVATNVKGSANSTSIEWRKPISFALDSQHRVEGFAGIRAVGSTSLAGFALFRRGRLIVGSGDETYRPAEIFGGSTTHKYQRLYGELTLYGFDVTHTKDGFQWDDLEEEFIHALETAMREGELDLIAQATDYRKQSIRDNRASIDGSLQKLTSELERTLPPAAQDALATPIIELTRTLPESTANSEPHRIPRSEATIRVNSEVWNVEINAIVDDGVPDWLQARADTDSTYRAAPYPERDVQVEVNLAHPFSRRFLGPSNENAEVLLYCGTVIGLALAIAKLNHGKAHSIQKSINSIANAELSIRKRGG